MRSLIRSIPGVTSRPKDLERTLGISASLAWQIHKFANADDPLAEIRVLPGQVAIERFLRAAAKRGAPESTIAQVRTALGDIEELVSQYAANRKEFESLLSGLSRDGGEAVDLKNRLATFAGQSHLLGFRADTIVSCFVYAPSRVDPSSLDAATMRTITGIRRFRYDTSIVVAEVRAVHDDGMPFESQPEPLVEETSGSYEGLIPQFCSQPLPVLKRVSTVVEKANVEVQPQGLGAKSVMTCTIGHSLRACMPRYRTATDTMQLSHTAVRIPCKLLIQDTLVYRGVFEPNQREVAVYTDHRGVDAAPFDRKCDKLRADVSAVFMGSGIHVLNVEEVPIYEDLMRFAFERMNWNIDDFDLYRVRIRYPLMPSSLVSRFDLREPPEERSSDGE
ncbi:MAG: hypothetical protein PVJ57_12315 [Phycisphaerae bacterium]